MTSAASRSDAAARVAERMATALELERSNWGRDTPALWLRPDQKWDEFRPAISLHGDDIYIGFLCPYDHIDHQSFVLRTSAFPVRFERHDFSGTARCELLQSALRRVDAALDGLLTFGARNACDPGLVRLLALTTSAATGKEDE